MHCLDVHDESNDCTIASFTRDWRVSKTRQSGTLVELKMVQAYLRKSWNREPTGH
jgi:hypothetical protein